MHLDRDLVAHRAGGQEHRGLLPEQLGDRLLQGVHGGILALLLVADLRLAHEAAHLHGGPGHGVAEEIDHGASSFGSVWGPVPCGAPDPVGFYSRRCESSWSKTSARWRASSARG